MTEQIYNTDAYQKEIQSEIIDIGEDYLILDKTTKGAGPQGRSGVSPCYIGGGGGGGGGAWGGGFSLGPLHLLCGGSIV